MGTDKNIRDIRDIREIRGQESLRRINITFSPRTCARRRTREVSDGDEPPLTLQLQLG